MKQITGFYHFITLLFPRLHEFDEQVRWVREGMAEVIPVPLLSLFTGYELETMVNFTVVVVFCFTTRLTHLLP